MTLRLPYASFYRALFAADPGLASLWYGALLVRALLPAGFAVATGVLVGALERQAPLTWPLVATGVIFLLMQTLGPIHQALGANLGDRTAASLYDRLTAAASDPPGIAHLESPTLATDLTVARDFDLGMTGPPLAIALDFIAGGLVELLGGIGALVVLAAYAWWAPLVLGGAWFATHRLLMESGVWKDRNTDEVRQAQRVSEYLYRLAVDAPAAKEMRLFGLADWTLDRFVARRTRVHALQYAATRFRERPFGIALVIVAASNAVVFWAMASDLAAGRLTLGQVTAFAQAAVGASMVAFGGLNWALDGAAAPVDALDRLEPAMAAAGRLPDGSRAAGSGAPAIRFRSVTFAYPGAPPVLDHLDLEIPAGSSLAIVGQNGAGKTTLAKLLCRLYDPQAGAIEVDGVDLREVSIDGWRSRVTAVFQDFIRFEWPMRDNVAPRGAPDASISRALEQAGASTLAPLGTVLARGYDGGTELSGGQWQRVALARALCAVEEGARLVLLDEPTAQLDVRGEAEIFERILAATRACTTILVSHRFSTVRHVDRICVLEHGRVIELGSHDELMALGGRYRTMFDLQAKRFTALDEEGVAYDVLG